MTVRARRTRLGIGATLALLGGAGGPAFAPPSARADAVTRGVTTHFAQGWPPRLLRHAHELGADMIRDSVRWAAVETVPGRLVFTPANSGHIDRACAAGFQVLLGLEPRHPLFDGGQTAFSAEARRAFARFVGALASRWPKCVTAIEIGNEINSKGGMTGRAADDRIAAHVALLGTVRDTVKPAHPELALLGGSTNTIPVGFLTRLFRAGALEQIDGLAIHPYRPNPEGVDREIARLNAAMATTGRRRPIWATEFSHDFVRPEDAPAYYLKMIALMEAAGVRHHLWYALADQPAFPAMGLVRLDGTEKPAARAFRFIAQALGARGAATRIDLGDPTLFHFRFGADAHVVWGAPRRFTAVPAGASPPALHYADGSPAPTGAQIAHEPLVVLGARDLRFAPGSAVADSLYGFAQPPLAWFSHPAAGRTVPLRMIDRDWTSHLGLPGTAATTVTAQGIGAAKASSTLVRHVAGATGHLFALLCLRVRPDRTAPEQVRIVQDGTVRWTASPAAKQPLNVQIPLTVRQGDTIDLIVAAGPNRPVHALYRWRISRTAADPASCPGSPAR